MPQVPPAGAVTDDGKSPAPSQGEQVSSKLAMLIKREQAALQKQRELKSLMQQFDTQKGEVEEAKKLKAHLESLKSNPKSLLEFLQLNPNELAASLTNDGAIPVDVEVRRLREELENYKKQNQDKELEAKELSKKQEAAQNEKLIEDYKVSINTFITEQNQKDNKYELIAFENKQQAVFDKINEHFTNTQKANAEKIESEGGDPSDAQGEVLDMIKACDEVEKSLESKYNDSKKLTKIQMLWRMMPKDMKKEIIKAEIKTQNTPPKTLTNQLSATPMKPRISPMTDDERIARALAYAKEKGLMA